jgi:ABC-type Fe3+ transport system substrate-binding protein
VVESELEKDPKFREWVEKLPMKWEDYKKHERDTKRALRNAYRREHGIPY